MAVPSPAAASYPCIDTGQGYYACASGVWQETNGVPGLQKAPWCDPDGRCHEPDTKVL